MQIETLHKKIGDWLSDSRKESDTVLSSRIRLARNLDRKPFCHWASSSQRKEIYNELVGALKSSDFCSKGMLFLRIDELPKVDRMLLVERYLISIEHSHGKVYSGLAFSEGEIISLMINEEDHLRMQVLYPYLRLHEAFGLSQELEMSVSKKVKFAANREFGFLTSCPTNVGTGLRASVMVHLPALVIDGQIGQILQAVNKLGLAVRGIFGEGTQSIGSIFQISNQVTLGKTEEEIIIDVEKMVKEVTGYEQKAREKIVKSRKIEIEDKIGRAYGVFTNAKVLSSKETIDLLSILKLGIDLGLLRSGKITDDKINAARIQTQPAHLQKFAGKELTYPERDAYRAKVLKDIFSRKRGK
ncbi:MAG: protein arginine kinase [bacterium]|nr:protein arginine kinase [bacterium]